MSKNGLMYEMESKLDQLKDTFASLGDTLGDVREDAQDRGEAILKNVTRMVKANPIAAIGIAAGAGFLVAMILRARR
jgi:ElaB/YqjD/DUF883 family membrane-anchored ribosome-binding protein